MPMWAGAETTGASSKASAGIGGIAGAPEAAYPLAKTSMPDNNLPYIGALEVAERNGVEGKRLWIVVDDIVYDCSDFLAKHPGGSAIIKEFGGQDCSWQWWTFHNKSIFNKYMASMRVGRTSGATNKHEQPQRKFFKLRTIGEQW